MLKEWVRTVRGFTTPYRGFIRVAALHVQPLLVIITILPVRWLPMNSAPDLFGNTTGNSCPSGAAVTSRGYEAMNSMEYYLPDAANTTIEI